MAKTQIDLFGKEDIENLHTLNKAKRPFNAKEIEMIKTKTGFSLLRNVQFIYELALAKKELLSFGLDFHIANDFRIFDVPSFQNMELLKRRLAYFESINGAITDYYYIIKYNQTTSVNQYLTHWVYPYKGKFHPQMIRALLNIMQIKEGETVLDPFVGSGTACIAALKTKRNYVAYDIDKNYCDLAEQRIKQFLQEQITLFNK